MHEASIAMAAIEQAIAAARTHRATRITRIELDVGVLREIVPDAIAMAFEACAMGTMAEGAKLDLHEESARARCRKCGCEFAPDLETHSFACGGCGAADAEMISGHEILLRSIECETDEEGEGS
jgi:hydrogenase nickel incorporation protein HypA/HybF